MKPVIPEVYFKPCQASMMNIRYLQRSRSHSLGRILTLYFSQDEIFEPFVEFNCHLSIQNDFHSKYIIWTA